MALQEVAERTVELSKDVKVEIEGRRIKVTGPKGTLEEDLGHLPVSINLEDGKVRVAASWPRKREIAMVGTAAARIRNMVKGVTEGFTYKMKIVYAHFPVTVKVDEKNSRILIENFTGEKTPRFAKIVGAAKVKVAGDEIQVTGVNLEEVSQTATNIQNATRIKEKDQRVFLDGIYVHERVKGTS